ncbi:thiamine biosynthesis lipoprotein ApbE [Spirochaetia bacterium]|nr:thiamine biosynthesis lipoprotein ApbE [Spirochaetia bacterium]
MRIFCFVLVFFCFFLAGCPGKPPAGEQVTEFVLGTFCSVTLYEGAKKEIFSRIFSRLREIDDEMSANKEGSVLDQINKNAGEKPTPVRPELMAVLEKALYYARMSSGAFDPAIGPLVKLWDINSNAGAHNPQVPAEEKIKEALALVDWRDLELDKTAGTAFLKRPGMALDLGAIAKGYAADEAARIIREAGLKRALINLGGNIMVVGARAAAKAGSPWRIGVQDPANSRGAYLGVLEIRDTSVVTSGVYERFFEAGGKRYHHILSTETGFPVDNGLLSVTIITGSSIDADALSTMVFALGYEKGLELIDSIDGAEAVFVFDDKKLRLSAGAEKIFTLAFDQ